MASCQIARNGILYFNNFINSFAEIFSYLIFINSFIYCQLYLENESDLPVSFSFFAEYTNVSTNYEKTILTFHDSLSFSIALARPGIIHFACRKENVSYKESLKTHSFRIRSWMCKGSKWVHRRLWHGSPLFFPNFLFTNLFSIKFLYFFIISSLFPYFSLFVSIFIQSYVNIELHVSTL